MVPPQSSQSSGLTKEQFRDRVCEEIRKRFPGCRTEPLGELSFQTENGPGATGTTWLDRGWKELCEHPERLDDIVERWVQSTELGVNFTFEAERVLPCFKTPDWLLANPDHVQPFLWTEPYNSELIISYAQYHNGLAHGFHKEWGLRREELWELSLANLRRMSSKLKVEAQGGFCALSAGNMWDSSLVLLDELRHHPALGDQGGRVMAVPDRDSCFIVDDRFPLAVFQLAIAAATQHRRGSYPLTPCLFAWGDDKWEPLDPQLRDMQHAIVNPEDVLDPQPDGAGGCVMPLHLFSPLTLDARSVYRLFQTFNAYLKAAASPEYCSMFGKPTPKSRCVEVRTSQVNDPVLMDLLKVAAYWLQDDSIKDICISMRILLVVVAA